MSFRDALAAIRLKAFPALRLPATTLSAQAAEDIVAVERDLPARGPGKDYDRIAQELGHKIRAHQRLDFAEARDGAWCLWATKPALADRPDTLGGVLDGIERHDKPKPYRALASSWLSSFDAGRPGMREASAVLERRAHRMGERWQGLQSRLEFFNVDRGPGCVVAEALRDRMSPPAKLQQFGLSLIDARSGYSKACAAEGLRAVAADGARLPEVRLRDVELLALDERRAVIFSDHAALVGRAMLAPYLQAAMPVKAVRDQLLALLIELFHDPRLEPGRWTSMPDCEAVVRRWLTEQSLRQFLDIVDRVADPNMWRYRRAFWEAVQRAELISDAWVVFDSTGAGVARRTFGKTASFGTFSGGATDGQAVLLLRIGRGIVAEWSHLGKCNIWRDASDSEAPQINQRVYAGSALRSLSDRSDARGEWRFASFVHSGSETYRWQSKVAGKLQDMTNTRLTQADYRVR